MWSSWYSQCCHYYLIESLSWLHFTLEVLCNCYDVFCWPFFLVFPCYFSVTVFPWYDLFSSSFILKDILVCFASFLMFTCVVLPLVYLSDPLCPSQSVEPHCFVTCCQQSLHVQFCSGFVSLLSCWILFFCIFLVSLISLWFWIVW